MSCFRPDNKKKLSTSKKNKPWKGLISSLRKKLNHLKKPKLLINHQSSWATPRIQHHHYHYTHYCHHHHHHHCLQDIAVMDKRVARDLRVKGDHDQDDLENDDHKREAKGATNGGVVARKQSTSMAQQLNGVDASAEEFIEKMKRSWILERQKSEENHLQLWARIYEH